MRTRIAPILLAALAASISAFALSAPENDLIAYPEHYREWMHVKSTYIGPQSPAYERNGGFHHFYANEKAVEGYRTGRFPDGSILVDERLDAKEAEGVLTEGPRRSLAVMVKHSRRYASTGGWGYEVFRGEGAQPERALTAEVRANCVNCHTKRKDQDYVFSSIRK